NSSSFSVSVVLPASGWEMMAKVRRRAASVATSGMANARRRARDRIGRVADYTRAGSVAAVLRDLETQDPLRPEHPERHRLQPHAAVGLQHEVQVRRGAAAGVPRQADGLALA